MHIYVIFLSLFCVLKLAKTYFFYVKINNKPSSDVNSDPGIFSFICILAYLISYYQKHKAV